MTPRELLTEAIEYLALADADLVQVARDCDEESAEELRDCLRQLARLIARTARVENDLGAEVRP